MSSAHADAVANRIVPDEATFASLPLPLAQRIFLALPADDRGRASCVCRAWRDVLDDTSLWTRLDMSLVREFLLHEHERYFAMLRGAAGRARGQLRHLDLSQQRSCYMTELQPVLAANAGSLRELHLHTLWPKLGGLYSGATLCEVLRAAPLLQVLTTEFAHCFSEDAPRLLRAEPPFAPLLQLRGTLVVCFYRDDRVVGRMEDVAPFAAALADAALQPALLRVCVEEADTAQPALMGALVDAALARRLHEFTMKLCTPPAAAPLARLLADGSLAVLEINSLSGALAGTPLFDAAGAALVADALRVNTTLTKLLLYGAHMCVDVCVVIALLDALVGHPSLREFQIQGECTPAEGRSAFGTALAALIAADAPVLQTLGCFDTSLADAGLEPIVEALPLNHHLRKLIMGYNGMSNAFACERLQPAVRVNMTLRELECDDSYPVPAATKAAKLVRRRGMRG